MITRDQALILKHGDIIHDPVMSGKCRNWRVNGMVKTWKRHPERFQVPLKYGLYGYGYLDECNAGELHLGRECLKWQINNSLPKTR